MSMNAIDHNNEVHITMLDAFMAARGFKIHSYSGDRTTRYYMDDIGTNVHVRLTDNSFVIMKMMDNPLVRIEMERCSPMLDIDGITYNQFDKMFRIFKHQLAWR